MSEGARGVDARSLAATDREVVLVAGTTGEGGAERYAVDLYKGLSVAGVEVGLIGRVPSWLDSGLPTFGTASLGAKWGTEPVSRSLLQAPSQLFQVSRAARRHFGATFHCQYKREQLLLTSRLARYGRVVWTEHGRFRSSWRSRAMARYYARASRSADAIICVSDAVADDVAFATRGRTRIEVIPNAVDRARFRPATHEARTAARDRFGLPADEVVALWIGRVDPGKLPDLAIASVLKAKIHLLFVGSGPSMDSARQDAGSSPYVHFAGRLANPEDAYAASDIVLFTSTGGGEGLPLVILEAASSGLLTLTHPASGQASVIASLGGQSADSDSPDSIAESLRDLAARVSQNPRVSRSLISSSRWLDLHAAVLSGVA